MIIATIKFENSTILIVNMHLPWDSAIKREESVVNIVNETTIIKCDYFFMLGDFNCSENSGVQRFLLGESSLMNAEANPCWKGKNSIETNQRFDRILMKSTYPNDHYGVCAELTFTL